MADFITIYDCRAEIEAVKMKARRGQKSGPQIVPPTTALSESAIREEMERRLGLRLATRPRAGRQ